MGATIKNRNALPLQGPAILVANHNSHLDTILLMSLYPLRYLDQVRPVAAEEYFFKKKILKWFSQKILKVIPLNRAKVAKETYDPLENVSEAINEGAIIIYYPEGTRGMPDQITLFKKGIAHLAQRHSNVPIIPIYIQGLGKVLPKGKKLIVPFNVQAIIGKPFRNSIVDGNFLASLRIKIISLAQEIQYA